MRVIEVKSCNECPFRDHSGQFTTGGAKPICNHPETVKVRGSDWKNRVIPYKNEYLGDGNKKIRIPKNIPRWCPLKDYKNV